MNLLLRIGRRLGLITLPTLPLNPLSMLRIGRRLGLITLNRSARMPDFAVADWSQAGIDYTLIKTVTNKT